MDEWKILKPTHLVEALGRVMWNGKNRLIALPRRITDCMPDLKNPRELILYKMQVCMSRKEFERRMSEIVEKEEALPILLYLKKEK